MGIGNSMLSVGNLQQIHCFESPFHSKLAMAVDWDLFYTLAHKKGMFAYIDKTLIFKRIHAESGTNESIQNGKRYRDDMTMFSRIWPLPIAS
jgi:hypothetical protein